MRRSPIPWRPWQYRAHDGKDQRIARLLGVLEIVAPYRTDAYRAVYTVRWSDAIYVLHAFQKKAQKTAQVDLDLAERRYREAQALAKERSHGKGQ